MWKLIEPILLEYDPPAATGRKRISQRAAFNALIFRLRSGCQWNQLPEEFPDDSSLFSDG
jgi:transposase